VPSATAFLDKVYASSQDRGRRIDFPLQPARTGCSLPASLSRPTS